MESFFSEMNAWEKECNLISDREDEEDVDEEWDQQTEKVKEIFSKYCTPVKRTSGTSQGLTWGGEGSYIYDPHQEKVVEVQELGSNEAVVITNRKRPLEEDHRYVVKKIDGTWLLHDKKRRMAGTNAWKTDYL